MHLSQFGTIDLMNHIFGYARIRQNPALGACRSRFISAPLITIWGFAIKDQANVAGAPMVALAALVWSLIANPTARGAPLSAEGPAAGIHPKG